MSPGTVKFHGLLGVALSLGLGVPAEAAKLHLRDGTLAIECHWTTDDAVIVTRGGIAIRIPREDVLRTEDESPSTEPCPSRAPEPTMTLGGRPSAATAGPPDPAGAPSVQIPSRASPPLPGTSGQASSKETTR